MKIKLPGMKETNKEFVTPSKGKTSVKQETIETQKKENTIFQILGFQHYSALSKLRIIVSTIFLLCTISLFLIFAGGWAISAVLLLLGYFLLLTLLVKLFTIKKL